MARPIQGNNRKKKTGTRQKITDRVLKDKNSKVNWIREKRNTKFLLNSLKQAKSPELHLVLLCQLRLAVGKIVVGCYPVNCLSIAVGKWEKIANESHVKIENFESATVGQKGPYEETPPDKIRAVTFNDEDPTIYMRTGEIENNDRNRKDCSRTPGILMMKFR
ncbi:hypothetical protein RCL_jg18028.t1 [Rhizophagus clarus]|uniref:Uncharacterized protein n=1 Tax=Rhizophagus clarus TaxID=94130 RepID=A0A8H3L8F5_9GLOM|nr:hypothetical protein RCL_jg18028.t1 [Rhizophagus clarus]